MRNRLTECNFTEGKEEVIPHKIPELVLKSLYIKQTYKHNHTY